MVKISPDELSRPQSRAIAREEIRDAIKLEEERRAALVKNLYRLRALRLSRNRNRMRIEEGRSQRS
jgi:hypothetical protein